MQGTSYFQLINPMVMGLFAIGFAMIWYHERRMRASLWHAGAYSCGAIGFTIDFALRDAVGPFWGQYISNVWLVAFPALVTCGVCERYRAAKPWLGIGAIYAATFALATWFLLVQPHSAARALTMNAGVGCLLFLALPVLWRVRRDTLTGIIFVILALTTVQFFIRPLAVIAYDGLGNTVTYSDTIYALTLHLTSAVCAISMAATLLFSMGIDVVKDLRHKGETDALTGLLDRNGLHARFAALAGSATAPVSVVIADIDHFKSVNDTFGHQAGDEAIRLFAGLLRAEAGEDDVVARIGGEEFVLLAAGSDKGALALRMDGLRRRLARCPMAQLDGRVLTASFGVAGCRQDEPLEAALKVADEALYRAKQSGRDRVCIAGMDGPSGADGETVAPIRAVAA